MEKLNQIKEILDNMQKDIEKFYDKGQNAAGTRIRKDLNNIRKLAADMRKEIQDVRNNRKDG
ncbi:MAG TPA: histone H1 [Ignavibacteria bacterium]|nr:histone H1 [Ignavibacteria bacterium]